MDFPEPGGRASIFMRMHLDLGCFESNGIGDAYKVINSIIII